MWEIRPHLFLGSAVDIADDRLQAHQIDFVISMIQTPPLAVRQLVIPIADSPDTGIIPALQNLLPVMQYELACHHNVLVHCFAGISRSVTVIVAFLMWSEHQPYLKAIADVRRVRGEIAQPNIGFELQLYEMFDEDINGRKN